MIEILKMFCSEDELRTWMLTPFTIGDRSYATDAHAMAICLAQDGVGDLVGYSPDKALSVVPKERMSAKQVPFDVLSELVSNAEIEKVYPEEECEACDGFGQVEADFTHKGKSYDVTADCPVCGGQGSWEVKTKPPKEVISDGQYVKIGVSYFALKEIGRMVEVANKLNETDIFVTYQTAEKQPSIFQIGEVEILQMSCAVDTQYDKEKVLKEIELN